MADPANPHDGDGSAAAAETGATGALDGHATPSRVGPATQHPAALLYGPGHVVVHGNAAFRALFGSGCLGLPAVEALLDLPRAAFDLMDLVYRGGRPLARRIALRDAQWRLTIAERRDIGTGEVYGIAIHLVPPELGDVPG